MLKISVLLCFQKDVLVLQGHNVILAEQRGTLSTLFYRTFFSCFFIPHKFRIFLQSNISKSILPCFIFLCPLIFMGCVCIWKSYPKNDLHVAVEMLTFCKVIYFLYNWQTDCMVLLNICNSTAYLRNRMNSAEADSLEFSLYFIRLQERPALTSC